MEAVFITSWLPILIVLVMLAQRNAAARCIVTRLRRKRKGGLAMTNEMIEKYVGYTCDITTGTMGVNATRKILQVNENWIELETRRGSEIINLEFIQRIKIKNR